MKLLQKFDTTFFETQNRHKKPIAGVNLGTNNKLNK